MIVTVAGAAYATPLEQRGPVEKGPGTLSAARKYLEGLWILVSYEIFQPGQSMLLEGEGTLVYDDFGNLEMKVRVDGDTALILEKAGIETTDGVLSTKGRTVIDLQARTLVFVLEGQPAYGVRSGPLALNRPRHWEVDGNVLTLTTRGEDGKPLSISRWQKKL
jgi:hypothetical protein